MTALHDRIAVKLALEFYADEENYRPRKQGMVRYANGIIHDYDRGFEARQALAALAEQLEAKGQGTGLSDQEIDRLAPIIGEDLRPNAGEDDYFHGRVHGIKAALRYARSHYRQGSKAGSAPAASGQGVEVEKIRITLEKCRDAFDLKADDFEDKYYPQAGPTGIIADINVAIKRLSSLAADRWIADPDPITMAEIIENVPEQIPVRGEEVDGGGDLGVALKTAPVPSGLGSASVGEAPDQALQAPNAEHPQS